MDRARTWIPWVAPLLVLAAEAPIVWPTPHVGEWFLFWYAGHLVASGASPYDPLHWVAATRDYGPVAHGVAINTLDGLAVDTIRFDYRWLWPPYVGLLLAPFGALPLEGGIPLLHLATIVTAVGSAFVLVRATIDAPGRALALTLLIASPPLVQAMRASTLTIVILPGIAILFVALRRASATRVSVAAIGISARTQLFLVTAPVVVFVFVRRHAARTTVAAIVAWLVFNVASFVLSPVPLDRTLLDAARSFTTHDNSSTWRFAELVAGPFAPFVAPLMLSAAIGLAVLAHARCAADERETVLVACVLALGVAIAPYAHTYDHLALFPVWLVTLRAARHVAAPRRALVTLGVFAVALGYGWAAYLVGASGVRAPIALTPYLSLIALTAAEIEPGTLRLGRTSSAVRG